MDVTRSTHAAAAKPAQAIRPQGNAQTVVQTREASAKWNPAGTQNIVGYGLPCATCHLYYPADLDACPTCHGKERVSPTVAPPRPRMQAATEPAPDSAAVEQEREAFLKQFKSQLVEAHAEVANSPTVCGLVEHHTEEPEAAAICKPCYDRLQERVDVCEAALHIDLKEAAQIVYDAVWADPSDPSKTYANAASALLGELRRRAGVSNLLSPFQPLGN
jgi:hypothetical protein